MKPLIICLMMLPFWGVSQTFDFESEIVTELTLSNGQVTAVFDEDFGPDGEYTLTFTGDIQNPKGEVFMIALQVYQTDQSGNNGSWFWINEHGAGNGHSTGCYLNDVWTTISADQTSFSTKRKFTYPTAPSWWRLRVSKGTQKQCTVSKQKTHTILEDFFN